MAPVVPGVARGGLGGLDALGALAANVPKLKRSLLGELKEASSLTAIPAFRDVECGVALGCGWMLV